MTTNAKMKVILAIWAIAFPVISCGPAIAGDGVGGTIAGGLFGLVLGSVLFIPWIIGIVVLGALVFITRPGRRDRL